MPEGVDEPATRSSDAAEPADSHTPDQSDEQVPAIDRASRVNREREYKRRYRQKNGDRLHAYRAQYHVDHREEENRRNREYMRERSKRLRAQAAKRERQRERERTRYASDPETRRAQIARWHEAHPEKNAEYSRRYYQRHRRARLAAAQEWRDQNPDKHAESMRAWQQRNREHLSDYQRQYRAKNPEAYERALAASRERQKVQRRLKQLDLPPIKKTRVKARDRRANDAAALSFFERRRAADERKRLLAEYEPLSSETLAQWKERSLLARRRSSQLDRFRSAVARVTAKVPGIQDEVRLDSTASEIRGHGPLDVDAELRQRVFDAAGGQDYLSGGGDRYAAAIALEDALEGHVPSLTHSDGEGMVWVAAHTRSGRSVSGHWRRRPS